MPASPKRQAAGIAAPPPKAKNRPKQPKQDKYNGLNKTQSKIINQTNQSDYQLGGMAQGQLGAAEQNYSQGFDYSQLPESPWAQGQTIEQMNDEYYNKALGNYDRSMQDQYKQQDDDFEQQMSNRGIPLGSELYNKLKAETQKTRDSARQNAMDSAYFNAGQNATTWNNLGTQNFQNAYGFQQDKYNQPLSTYSNIMAAQSGMPMQNLGYSQNRGLQQQQGDIARSMPRGGGGGGGGTPPIWQQWGAASPQEYAAQQEQIRRDNQLWNWQNDPSNRKPSGPSYSTQLGGGLLGAIGTGWAMGGFQSPF